MITMHSRSFWIMLAAISHCWLLVLVTPSVAQAQFSSTQACDADIDQAGIRTGEQYSGTVNLSDYLILVQNFLQSQLSNPRANISKDSGNQVNLTDYSILVKWFLRSVTCPLSSPLETPSPSPAPSMTPAPSSLPTTQEWNQDGGNAQRTGYTPEDPNGTWRYLWSFNGADASGGIGGHFYNAPKEARTVIGTTQGISRLYVPAGVKGLYALDLQTGRQLWQAQHGVFDSTPAYDPLTEKVYVVSTTGVVYKLDPSSGSVIGSYATSSTSRKSPLIVGSHLFVATDDGKLHKLATSTMTAQPGFPYVSGSPIDTPPSYSATRGLVIFATRDLLVHAVLATTGQLHWKVKPTPNAPGAGGAGKVSAGGQMMGAQFNLGWPVVADNAGVVLLRLQLPHQAHYEGPSYDSSAGKIVNDGRFRGVSNAQIKSWLAANPAEKNLFALSLDTGLESFVPAVGYGSTEDYVEGVGTQGVMGSIPVVKTLPSGKQVAYTPYRSQLPTSTHDYRWSGQFGEMLFDGTTVSGYSAGDIRSIQLPNAQTYIIDEQEPLGMAGNVLVHNHWAGAEIFRIIDRADHKGSLTTPITTIRLAPIMRAIKSCGSFSATTHFTSCSSVQYPTDGAADPGSGRSFQNIPGAFYAYWNVADPPGWRVTNSLTSGAGTSYSTGFQPRYTYVSNGYIVTEGNGGDIMVLTYR